MPGQQPVGRRRTGKTRQANRWLKTGLTQAAWAAGRTRRSYFSAQHRRLTTRRGVKRATIAVAHSLLVVCHRLLSDRSLCYSDLGPDYFDRIGNEQRKTRRMIAKLEAQGYQVTRPVAA